MTPLDTVVKLLACFTMGVWIGVGLILSQYLGAH